LGETKRGDDETMKQPIFKWKCSQCKQWYDNNTIKSKPTTNNYGGMTFAICLCPHCGAKHTSNVDFTIDVKNNRMYDYKQKKYVKVID